MNFSRFVTVVAIASALSVSSAASASEGWLKEVATEHPFLRSDRRGYENFALSHFQNYPNHHFPYIDTPRRFYGPMGTELITGYDLFQWRETRTPGQEYGSSIQKPNEMYSLAWNKVYDATVIGRDGYGDWGYSLIVGDNMIARLSPLTLSMTDFNGFRMDLATYRLKLTGMASRIERPHVFQTIAPTWATGRTQFADDSTLLLGGRLQADLGAAKVGINLANSHVYGSTQPGNSIKGVLRPDHPLMDWVIVRFTDDSPLDGAGGAVVQDVVLHVNGEERPDLVPSVIRHQAGVGPQVGNVSAATGRFRAVDYRLFSGHRLYYRGRDEIPLYADYFNRIDHEEGLDVSSAVRLDGLLENLHMESPDATLIADGGEQLVYLFDLTGESRVESVELEALLANDYRVDVALLATSNARAKNYYSRYRSTFYRTRLRSRGNVGDRSNLRRVRFDIGEDTGLFIYSADAALDLPGLEIIAEYARSARFARYPSHIEGIPAFSESPRFSERGGAYYANAIHWFESGRIGGELFSIGPQFTSTFRTNLNEPPQGNLRGMMNETMYWDLVQDNDDGDRFPDRRVGDIEGFIADGEAFDLDGVFLAQDADNDGWPEINRDGDGIPDFEEPFLMFDVEPNIYVYGLDRNNNDEPDKREDDGQVDYPYDPDQRGYHLFVRFDLLRNLSLAAGRYDVDEVAGSGRNRSTYALLTYQSRSREDGQWLMVENNLRRVQDDIRDDYIVVDARSDRTRFFGEGRLALPNTDERRLQDKPPIYSGEFVRDLNFYKDSYVNETYLQTRFRVWPKLIVQQAVRARFNWQRGGELYNGLFQRKRRLDLWSWVSRMERSAHLGKLKLTAQYKFMALRLVDRERDVKVLAERRSIPILRLEYPLLSRTSVRLGIQGMGAVPYRFRDETAARNSFEQRTMFATITNQSKYFGYELVTIAGFSKDRLEFDSRQDRRASDVLTVFVRGLIGFTEFGRPI